MNHRPMSRILDEVSHERGKQAKLGRKLRANRERNWLLALTLNTFAKAADDLPTNDLDSIILAAFEAEGLGGEVKEHGRMYAGMSPQLRQELFPGSFGMLPDHADYTLADLASDLPGLDEAVRSMPNATDIDVVGVHEGRVHLADTPRPRRSVIARHGSELIRAVAEDGRRARDAGTDPFRIKATSFHCTDETGIDWLGSDEVYFITASTAAGVSVTSRSRIFEDIDSGDNGTFGVDEGWIWGHNGTPQSLPEGEIGVLIQAWEHDDGDPDKVKAEVAAAFAVAAAVLTASGVAAWVGAVVAGVGAVVQWLVGFLDDDHIGDTTIVFTRQTILDQAGKVGASFDVTQRLHDDDGDYTVTVTVAHLSPPPPSVTVPDVFEASVSAAVATLVAAGLVARTSGPNTSKSWVQSQSPTAGSMVARGSTVNLRLSIGERP
ncbi:MAG: PASTA domain-containing protein [Dermatophilaceae bacterium]